MVFGDDPSQGVIAGAKFVHPPLRFAFEVPSGYKLVNLPDVVAIKGPKGTLGNLTLASPQPSGSLTAAMQNYDPKGRIVFDNIENFTVNGMEAATAVTRVNTNSGSANYRAVLIRHPKRQGLRVRVPVARRSFAPTHLVKIATSPPDQCQRSASKQAAAHPTVTVKAGDTVQSLSNRMVGDEKRAGPRAGTGLTASQVQAARR
jgi:predicted Zn-dependent protease